MAWTSRLVTFKSSWLYPNEVQMGLDQLWGADITYVRMLEEFLPETHLVKVNGMIV